MESIINDYKNCQLCSLAKFRGLPEYEKICFYRGQQRAKVCVLAEAPGKDEAKVGIPLVGRSGQLIDTLLKQVDHPDFQPDKVHFCNTVCCRPDNNRDPNTKELTACMERLCQQVNSVQPQVLILLGNISLYTVHGRKGIMSKRGYLGPIEKVASGKFKTRWIRSTGEAPSGFWVGATFHPAYALRGPSDHQENAREVIKKDLQSFARRLSNG